MKKQEIKKALKNAEVERIMFKVLGYDGIVNNYSKYIVVSTDENGDNPELIDAITLAGVNCFVRAETQKGRETFIYETAEFLTMLHDIVEIA